MATGPDHYREAEHFAKRAESASSVEAKAANAALATAHATLALAAATALTQPISGTPDSKGHASQEAYNEWFDVAG